MTGVHALNAKVLANAEAHSREPTVPWDHFFVFEFDKILEDQRFSLAGQFCLKVFEPPEPLDSDEKDKRKESRGFINPYTNGEEALEPKELIYRCSHVAKVLESFRIMENKKIERIVPPICTIRYDRENFEVALQDLEELDYRDPEDVPDHQLSHYWESAKMRG